MENYMEQPKVKLDISQTPWAACDCGGQAFDIKYMFKKVSALMSPTGKEEHIPIETVLCLKCGKVPSFLWKKYPDLPDDLKAKAPIL